MSYRWCKAIGMLCALALGYAGPASAQEQSVLFAGLGTVGNAWEGTHLYGSWILAVEAEGQKWAPRIGYERVGVSRACHTSGQARCGVESGRLFVVGVSRSILTRGGAVIYVRPDAGVARWANKVDDVTDSELVLGASVELRMTVGSGAVSVGSMVRRSPAVTLGGVFAGLGIRL